MARSIRQICFLVAAICAIFGGAQLASAQWSENFDSLPLYNNVAPNKGWETWDQAAGANSLVMNTQSYSLPNSLRITGTSDTIHRYQGYTGGHWEYKTKIFVPSTSVGRSWFILMNKYVHNSHANQDWSVQIAFNAQTNSIFSQEANVTGTLIEDAWFELKVDINLATNLAKIYVNNVLFAQHPWVGPNGSNGLLQFQCVDLYAENPSTVAYYDDMSLTNLDHCCTDLLAGNMYGYNFILNTPLAQTFKPTYTGLACDIITGVDLWTSTSYDMYLVATVGGQIPLNYQTNYLFRALNQTAQNTAPGTGPVNCKINALDSMAVLWAGTEYAIIVVPNGGWTQWLIWNANPYPNGSAHYLYASSQWIEMTGSDFSFKVTGLQNKLTQVGGFPDNYTMPEENPYRSAALNGVYPSAIWRKFDEGDINKWLGHTFKNLPGGIMRARLKFECKPEIGSDATNDSVSVGLLNNPGSPTPPAYWQYTRRLDQLPESGGTWNTNNSTVFTLDLHNLPGGGNVIGQMNATGMLDVWIQDDTNVDWVTLEVWFCPPTLSSSPFGFPWTVLGNATLEFNPATQALEIGNIGSSGQDGAEVELGEGMGVDWTYHAPIPITTAGAKIFVDAVGSVNGVPNSLIGTASTEGKGGYADFSADFSPVGSSQQRLFLLDANGTVIHTSDQPNGAKVQVQDISFSARIICEKKGDVAQGRMSSPGSVGLPDGTVVNNVSSIEVQALSISASREYVSAERLRGSGMGSGKVSFSSFSASFFDVFAEPLPGPWDTTSSFSDGGTVFHTSLTGTSDSTLDTAVKASWNLKKNVKRCKTDIHVIADVDQDGQLDVGAALGVTAIGMYNGESHKQLGRLFVRKSGTDQIDYFVAFDPIGATAKRIELYNQGTLVYSTTQSAEFVGSSNNFPLRIGKLGQSTTKCFATEFQAGTTFHLGGSLYVGDELRLLADGVPGNVGEIERFEFEGSHIQEMMFSNFVTEQSTVTVGGVITLEDYSPGPIPQSATIEIRSVGSTISLETQTVPLAPDGSYSFATSLRGNYDIAFKGSHWLRKVVTADVSGSSISLSTSLENGDCDDDNEITLLDYSILASAFGSAIGDPTWDPRADLDGDGEVTLADYSILSRNFGDAGDD